MQCCPCVISKCDDELRLYQENENPIPSIYASHKKTSGLHFKYMCNAHSRRECADSRTKRKKMFFEIKNRFQGSIEATVVWYYESMFFNIKFCWYNHFASSVRTDTYLYIITEILHVKQCVQLNRRIYSYQLACRFVCIWLYVNNGALAANDRNSFLTRLNRAPTMLCFEISYKQNTMQYTHTLPGNCRLIITSLGQSLLTRIDLWYKSQWRLHCSLLFLLLLFFLLTPDPPSQLNSWACFFDFAANFPMGLSPTRAWIMKPLIVSPAPLPWIFTSIDSFWSELNWFLDKINLYGASDDCGSTWCCGVISPHAPSGAPAEYE